MASVEDIYRYRIESMDATGKRPRAVAEHGMGSVYKAYDFLRDEFVAVKVVRDEVLRKQEEKAKRQFLAEAIAGARLSKQSEHIVKVFDIGQLDDILYMGQEWVSGGNIVSKCGTISLFRARTILLHICKAVKVAHANKIVHSDIAPANILYDELRDIYKLSDFGLLKLMSNTSISVLGSSAFMTGGRRDYMPKEHFDNPKHINYSTDVFALAMTFYVLLTGELLRKDEEGRYAMPGPICAKGDANKRASKRVESLLDEFVIRRSNNHTIDQFLDRLCNIPV